MNIQYDLKNRAGDWNLSNLRKILEDSGVRTGIWSYSRSPQMEKMIEDFRSTREYYDIIIIHNIKSVEDANIILGALIGHSWDSVTYGVIK